MVSVKHRLIAPYFKSLSHVIKNRLNYAQFRAVTGQKNIAHFRARQNRLKVYVFSIRVNLRIATYSCAS